MSPWYIVTTSNAGSVMAPSFIPKFQQKVAHFKHNYSLLYMYMYYH